MSQKISPIYSTLIVVTLSTLLVVAILYAWTGPTAAPPGGNVPAPINGGSDPQQKTGSLGLGGLSVNYSAHLATLDGNVGIGTTEQPLSNAKLGVNGVIYTDFNNTPYGAQLSGSNGGHGVFGSNFYIGSDNEYRTFGTHDSYGYSGIDASWGELKFYTATGNTTKDGIVSPTSQMIIKPDGNVGIGTTYPEKKLHVQGDAKITGKLTLTTLDPQYEIGGKIYATYGSSIAGGVKEETMGIIKLGPELRYVIDFNNLETGSNLWLFNKITDFGEKMEYLIVNLTPDSNQKVWYEKKPEANKLIIYGEKEGEISYRFIANRNDWRNWPNEVKEK